MARPLFRIGDLVEIVTVDRGRGGRAYKMKRHDRTERWRGVILMRSPLVSDWWVVKKCGYSGRTYTVPGAEMTCLQRDPRAERINGAASA